MTNFRGFPCYCFERRFKERKHETSTSSRITQPQVLTCVVKRIRHEFRIFRCSNERSWEPRITDVSRNSASFTVLSVHEHKLSVRAPGLGKLNVVRCRRRRQRWMDALAGGAAAGNGGVPDSLGGRGRTWVGPPARHRESMGKAVAAGARFCAVLR